MEIIKGMDNIFPEILNQSEIILEKCNQSSNNIQPIGSNSVHLLKVANHSSVHFHQSIFPNIDTIGSIKNMQAILDDSEKYIV